MSFCFTKENDTLAQSIVAKYPYKASALLPLLDLAQRQNQGFLSDAAIEFVSNFLSMPKIKVLEVATFYTMFHLKPVGKYHIQVCGTVPCSLRGAKEIMEKLSHELGLKFDDKHRKPVVTDDLVFSIQEVECLGACINAPLVQINDDYLEDVSIDKLLEHLRSLKANASAKRQNF